MKLYRLFFILMAFFLTAPAAYAVDGLTWQPWSEKVFEQAKKENKLVLLDVEAVWCHWCHVMHETTYKDKKVLELLRKHFITTRADQDAHPDISRRYENYGWPATVMFTADGTEITKKRGYLEPELMATLLGKIIADPSPRRAEPEGFKPSDKSSLSSVDRESILTSTLYLYDKQHGGWGDIHRYLDPLTMEYALRRSEHDLLGSRKVYETMARQSLDGALNLIDPVWGGVYQYSDELDWKSPHFEKIMASQVATLESYIMGYQIFGEEKYRKAAFDVARYLRDMMTSPEGAFYTSQDADVNQKITGHIFYAKDDKGRRALGMPRIDKNLYARENGMAIYAFAALYQATGDKETLDHAIKAAQWITANRTLPDGGFSHGEDARRGPYLSDTLHMGRALLALYQATGDRAWLTKAEKAARFIAAHFADKESGAFVISEKGINAKLKPLKDTIENILTTRFFNLLHHYTGNKSYRETAEAGMRYLASPALVQSFTFQPGLLLADMEVNAAPLHLTIVGHKDDPAALALYQTALASPYGYKRVEWWDKREGAMPNEDVGYPELDKAAAFVCTNRTCSLPLLKKEDIQTEIKRSLEGE